MGREFQYTTLDRIISKIYRDLGLEEISETDLVEWSGEALEGIGAIGLYEEAVAFIEVCGHKADLPKCLHSIQQIARDNQWEEGNGVCPANAILDCSTEDISEEEEVVEDCPVPVPLDCNGSPLTDYDLAYYRPYFDLQYEYHGWCNSKLYHTRYTPIRLSNHTFFNSVVEAEDPEIYSSSSDEYTLNGGVLTTSFEKGAIAISYQRQKMDPDTGYPMIPDDYSIITAITMYITMKYMGRMWYSGREGYVEKFKKAEQDWQWYCRQAGNKIMKPYGVDQHQNILEGRSRLIPNRREYYGFFGNLGKEENKGYFNSLRTDSRHGRRH